MKEFTKLLKKLTTIIREDKTLHENSFDLLIVSEITSEESIEIKKETAGKDISSVDEFWELTEEIYKSLMLKTITTPLFEFFKKLQSENTIQTLKVSYTFSPWDKFSLIIKDPINADTILLKEEIVLEVTYAEGQIRKLLEHFGIVDTDWYQELYDFDYSFNFQSSIEAIFHEIAFSCWSRAKEITNSKTLGFISESRGGSYLYNLDTKDNLDEMKLTIPQYLGLYK